MIFDTPDLFLLVLVIFTRFSRFHLGKQMGARFSSFHSISFHSIFSQNGNSFGFQSIFMFSLASYRSFENYKWHVWRRLKAKQCNLFCSSTLKFKTHFGGTRSKLQFSAPLKWTLPLTPAIDLLRSWHYFRWIKIEKKGTKMDNNKNAVSAFSFHFTGTKVVSG